MNKDLTLVIMAAGMGSRFGGLKQIEPFGPNGEFILDYSVYDAIRAGFNKVVFIIKEEHFDLFKQTVGNRISDKIAVEYAFQKNDDLPGNMSVPERIKPWGTGHAIRAARNVVTGPFAAINADDFYGLDAFQKIAQFLSNIPQSNKSEYAIVGYMLKNTLSELGSVKRGVCEVQDGKLTKIIESKVERVNGEMIATPLDGREPFVVSEDTRASMSVFGFDTSLMPLLEGKLVKFLEKNKNNFLDCEFLLPDVLDDQIKTDSVNIQVLDTDAQWYGVTYKEDKEGVVNAIQNLIDNGEYPSKLWN